MLPLRLPAVPRLVAIGDLHGDFEKTRRAFRAAGLITGENDTWSGGSTTVVQARHGPSLCNAPMTAETST